MLQSTCMQQQVHAIPLSSSYHAVTSCGHKCTLLVWLYISSRFRSHLSHGHFAHTMCVTRRKLVNCRCFLSFVFLGVARRLELSPCNTEKAPNVCVVCLSQFVTIHICRPVENSDPRSQSRLHLHHHIEFAYIRDERILRWARLRWRCLSPPPQSVCISSKSIKTPFQPHLNQFNLLYLVHQLSGRSPRTTGLSTSKT